LFKNARNVLDSPLNIASKGWIERVHSIPRGYPLIPPSIAGEIFDNISEGIRTSKKLACIYKKPDGSVSNRTLAPLGLIERGGFFYLVSRDEGDGVVKKFKLNRFEAVQLTSEGFLYPRDFDMRHELRKGDISPTFSPERINVRLRLERSAGAHLLEAKLGDDQMIHLNDGKFIELSATVDNSDELRWWIMAICDKCEILEPEALRRELNERIKSAQKLYGSERATDA
jgi:predicted DNA-binding transcriptional regulator YafY